MRKEEKNKGFASAGSLFFKLRCLENIENIVTIILIIRM